MTHFDHHVFFCTNQRKNGESCCNDHSAEAVRTYAKNRVKALGDDIRSRVRINTAGCLDRCELGPVLVVYPEGIWYRYVDNDDIDEIIEQHLINGQVVARLQI